MGDTRFLRALVAGATGAVLAVTLATPAGASGADARTDRIDRIDRQSVTGSTPHERVLGDATTPVQPEEGYSALADVPAAACPRGSRLTRTVVAESFETGLPDPQYTYGWDRVTTDAVAGSWAGRSTWTGPDATPADPDYHEMYLGEFLLTPGTTTYLSFASRGSDEFDNIYFGAFGALWGDDLTADWTRIQVPVTEGIDADGYLYPVLAHEQDDSSATWWEVDDVKVITCGPVPATGVRGDWTADMKVDVLTTDPDGLLGVFAGRGDGDLDEGFAVGGGWGSMTYIGSPGDINGDRRTDLIARSSNGTLYLYGGVGDGVFRKAVPIGQKWNGMTALITTGDVENDGRPDLMARRADGTMHLYRFSSTGALTYTRQIGAGWNGMAWMVGVGDISQDGRGDVLGITRTGDMYSYRGTPGGLVGIGQVGTGWQDRTWVTSPGDLDGDGRGDVLARDAAGDLYFHAGTGNGVAAGRLNGVGWGPFVRIL